MTFVYKYNSPRGYFITKNQTFQVRTTYQGINQAHGTYKTEDEAHAHFLAIKAVREGLK